MAVSVSPSDRWRRLAWGLGLLATLVGLVWVASEVRSVTVPLVTGFIIAYLLDPLVDRLESRRLGRTPAIAVLLFGFLVLVVAVLLLLGPQVVKELAQIPGKLHQVLARFVPWLEATFHIAVPHNVEDAFNGLLKGLDTLDLRSLARPAGSVLKAVFGGTVSVIASFAGAVMVPVFAFYLLRDFDDLVAWIHDLIPASYRAPISARFREIDAAMSSFIRGQVTVAAILAGLYSLGLWVVGLPLALVVGLVAGFGNMIPYVGTTLGLLLATLMALIDWHGFGHLLVVYAVFAVVQGLEGWVITPKIVGESVGLSPFAVIVAILFFGAIFGFFGILIAVPLAAVLKILLRVALDWYRASDFYREA